MVNLRPAAPADEPFLWTMLYEASYAAEQGLTEDDLRSIPELAHYVAEWGSPGDLGVIAEAGSHQPLGAAWLRLMTGDNAGYGYVDDRTPELSIGVRPSERGTGIGAAMLERLLHDAAARYDAVSLSVRESNPAIRLYERVGFEVLPGSRIVNQVDTGSVTMIHRFR